VLRGSGAHRRVLVVFGVVVALVFGLSACAFGGNAVDSQQVNLDNQRKVAVAFLEWQGGVEEIRFTREGGESGFGAQWAVNAVVTIHGEDYQMILGTQTMGGDPLPEVGPGSPPTRTTVIFSDGSSEVMR
jgi:hypothetical protein